MSVKCVGGRVGVRAETQCVRFIWIMYASLTHAMDRLKKGGGASLLKNDGHSYFFSHHGAVMFTYNINMEYIHVCTN